MENPTEDEHRGSFHNYPDTQNAYPARVINPVVHNEVPTIQTPNPMPATSAGVVPNPVTADQSHNTHDGFHVLQWLTFLLWGLSLLALSSLTATVFRRLIAGTNDATFNYYLIATLVILVPAAFICDVFYTRQEPEKKIGASSRIMTGYSIIFALFGIFALLSIAWNIVAWATGHGLNHSGSEAAIISSLLILIYYLAAFVRTLNPTHIRGIAKTYRLAMLVVVIIFIILGFAKLTFASSNPPSPSPLTHTSPSINMANDCSSSQSSGEQLNKKGCPRPSQYLQICEIPSTAEEYVTQGNPQCLGSDSYVGSYSPGVPGTLYSSPCETTSGGTRYVYVAEGEQCPDTTKLVFYNVLCPQGAESSSDCITSDSTN